MSKPVISVEGLCKQYRLGQVGSGTIAEDFSRLISRLRGKEDPFLKIGETNYRDSGGDSDFVWALHDVNFKVNEGEVLGIIGKNGAGKSTLLKLLSRVTGPTKGTIKMRGRIASLLEVGTGFHPDMTGRENVYMNGTLMGMTRNEITKKLDEIVDFSGVERYLDTPVKRYSSGMKVRLGFAVAAHLESEILIVDEVLAVGDAEFQQKAIGKMKDISSQGGRTVLFVSHNLTAVQNLCTEGLLIEDGTVALEGKVEDVLNQYMHKRFEKAPLNTIDKVECIDKSAFIESIKIENSEKEKLSIQPGCDVKVLIGYKCKGDNLKANFFVGMENTNGERIVRLGTSFGGADSKILQKQGIYECLIPNFPLLPGEYLMGVSLVVDGRMQHQPELIRFEVQEGDFFGTGKLPAPHEARFLLDHKWSIS